jgi:tight adherence protein B
VAQAVRVDLTAEAVEHAWPAIGLAALAVVISAAVLFGLPGVLAVSVVTIAGPPIVGRRVATARRRRRAGALPALLEDVARGLRSGASLRQALMLSRDRADVTLRPELGVLCDAVAHGGSLEVALERWSEREPTEGLRMAVAALCLGIDAGGAHGRALDGVAASLRDQLAVDREIAALSSQARASATVMAVAPLAFAAFTVTADPRTAHFLLGTTSGLACLGAGLALDAIAAWWMLRITGAER